MKMTKDVLDNIIVFEKMIVLEKIIQKIVCI